MNLVELDRTLRQTAPFRDGRHPRDASAAGAEREDGPARSRLRARTDELQRRQDRLLDRRHTLARFRDPDRSLDTFDFDFNKKINRALVYDLATARFIAQREDVLLLGPPGTGKSHLAQTVGRAAIQQGYRVIYREAHTLLEELTEATLAGTRKDYVRELATVASAIPIGRAKSKPALATPRKPAPGQRFETIEAAQAYLDCWEEHWADTRIHGTTKRQVVEMFAEERPALGPLPIEPFRYYQFGERTFISMGASWRRPLTRLRLA